MLNQVCISGRLVKDPILKELTNNNTMATFTLAVDKNVSKTKKEEFKAKGLPTADFIQVVAWGALGDTIVTFTGKGCRLNVGGRIQTRNYTTDDGNKIYVTEVVATDIDIIDFKDSNSKTTPDPMDIEGFHPTNEDIPF